MNQNKNKSKSLLNPLEIERNDQDRVRQFIRYQIEQLSTRNLHHEFEDICLYYMKSESPTIIIKPATGPVAGLGDKGRDFEILSEPSNPNCIIIACSLEKKYKSKIRNDVKKIMRENSDVSKIVFFSSQDIQIRTRVDLEQENKAVSLSIYDAQALSLNLTKPHTIWIAIKYLSLPLEMIPFTSYNEEYIKLKQKWKDKDVNPSSLAHLIEIKSINRIILNKISYDFSEPKSPKLVLPIEVGDLDIWIEKLSKFTNQPENSFLDFLATYEIFFSLMKSKRPMDIWYKPIIKFLTNIEKERNIEILSSFSSLLIILNQEQLKDKPAFNIENLKEWNQKLQEQLTTLIDLSQSNSRKAELTEILVQFSLYKIFSEPDNIVIPNEFFEWEENFIEIMKIGSNYSLIFHQEMLMRYCQMFPQLLHSAKFVKFVDQIDDFLEDQLGKKYKAEVQLERGMQLLEQKQKIFALKYLHRAKRNYFLCGELYKTIIISKYVANIYSTLNLYHAAKYYSIMTSFMAINMLELEQKEIIPSLLEQCTHHLYQTGETYQFLHIFKMFTQYFKHFRSMDILDYFSEKGLPIIFHSTYIYFVAEKYYPEIIPPISYFFEEFKDGFYDFVNLLGKKMQNIDIKEFWNNLQNQLDMRYFIELLPMRTFE